MWVSPVVDRRKAAIEDGEDAVSGPDVRDGSRFERCVTSRRSAPPISTAVLLGIGAEMGEPAMRPIGGGPLLDRLSMRIAARPYSTMKYHRMVTFMPSISVSKE